MKGHGIFGHRKTPLFTRINKFMFSRAHRGPNVQEQLSSWWLPASLREIWPKCSLSSLYLVPNWCISRSFEKFFFIFQTLCFPHFYISLFFKTPCQISSAQTIWICEHFPIHHSFWLELHTLFSPKALWNAVRKKKPSTSKEFQPVLTFSRLFYFRPKCIFFCISKH